MLPVLITLTPGRRNEFIDSQKLKVRVAVLPIMDMKTCWDSTLELLERFFRLREITCEWLNNPQYRDHRPLFTTQDEWTIVKYVMEVLRPFRYWTVWMLKRHTVLLAMGPGNPPAVRVLTSGSVRFSSKPGQKPEPLMSWRVVTRTGHRTLGIWAGWNRTTV